MKRSVYIWMISLSFTSSLVSQVEGFHVGGRFGLGESSIVCEGLQNNTGKLAVSGGVTANYQVTKYLGLNADFLLTSSGAKASGSTRESGILGTEQSYSYRDRVDIVNAEVPLTGQLSVWFGDLFVRAYAGPGMNFNLLGVQTRVYDNENYNNGHGFINREFEQKNNISYSMIYGLGFGALSEKDQLYFLDLRLNRGISPAGKINNANAFVNYYCLTGGYIF